MVWKGDGIVAVPGSASGVLLASDQPLSFWGGYDPTSGEIIDRRHPLSGRFGANAILALPATRGSSTTTAVLLESIRSGFAPSAFVTTSMDTFLALASVVGAELYRKPIPMVVVADGHLAELVACYRDSSDGSLIARLETNGAITVGRQ